MNNRAVAIFVDAGFFVRHFTKIYDPDMDKDPVDVAKAMWHYWVKHVDRKNGEYLYRIYFYDCRPLMNKAHHPITNEQIDFSKSDISKYKNSMHEALIRQPFVACRMGHLSSTDKEWGFIRKDKVHNFNKIIRGDVNVADIEPDNVSLRPRQKGVDMKLGIDIACVVLKKLANKIVLISGDSDFVPAAKLARVEGAHFILDAMGRTVKGDLAEHIDGLKSFTVEV
jgi:uncharacterized LabA/DUF88 family protein